MTSTHDSTTALPAVDAALAAKPCFPLGQILITPGAQGLLESYGVNVFDLLLRHAAGDWGDVPLDDAKTNDAALVHGHRLLSCYPIVPGLDAARVWVITECDRSCTTILLPTEY